MYRWRAPLIIVLLILVFFDAAMGFRLRSGWPTVVSLSGPAAGVQEVHVTRIPFTASDWLIILVIAGVHIIIIRLNWVAWRSPDRGAGRT